MILFLFVILTAANTAFCQISFVDKIDSLPPQLRGFVIQGYTPLDTAFADLNSDGIKDAILVLKSTEEGNTDTEFRRPLLLLIGQKDAPYKIAFRNDDIVFSPGLEDPFYGVKARKGQFTIEHSIWGGQHWQEKITFKYDSKEKDWFLHRIYFLSMKFNPSRNPNAEALIKDKEYTKTVKNFGRIRFVDYKSKD